MDTLDSIIELRILLESMMDGFDTNTFNKNSVLSSRTKVLFLLSSRDMSPSELIKYLCIAKTNLANLLKSMKNDGLVEIYKKEDNSKNIYCKICDKGILELDNYRSKVLEHFDVCRSSLEQLSNSTNKVINILRGKK